MSTFLQISTFLQTSTFCSLSHYNIVLIYFFVPFLPQASSKLLNNSEALVEETEQLINAHITNQDNVNQLYSETASAIEEIDIVESTANKTFGIVYSTEVQNLPEKTAGLSANASSTVSKLYAALLTSPSVDIVFLEEVENFVKGLEK